MQNTRSNKFNLIVIKILSFICLYGIIGLNAQEVYADKTDYIDTSFLESKKELEDYILDTGDILNIEFDGIPEISGSYSIDQQGEIYFKRIKYSYVRGLTIKELTVLLEKRYKEFLVNPEVYIRIEKYKPINV